ncbi:DEAD/DEAH box helicase [Leptospira ilyithenensis]|uniref:DEAD/DEAH box helicase n=1 Tax=Leptospira ilyithenensis TaxID=2484901 RepID=A0A4R9LTE0_9LEPT|nr:SNF2-related protein [Leptospira ilyithenensis]TGN10940.1 DEAD/DEAH box helicase [Leptospira ilyithenensis]
MEIPTQLSLDFESVHETKQTYEYAFLTDEPELGFGKILNETNTSLELLFESKEIFKTISKRNPKLYYLKKYPNSLREWEEFPRAMEVALQAYQLKLTHSFDKLSSLSNSRTRLLPHQIESTFIVANSLRPRFILADEVGLGKTIEAGLAMKELMFRRGLKRVLVVAPSPLLIQWQQEMRNKFNEDFAIVRRRNFITNGEDHWRNFNKVITSIDFIKNPIYAEEILKVKWDIVIFDEAHRLRRDYSKITRGYLFAEKISRKTECLLLLTATPFRGKLEELFYLLHLVDPNILGPYHTFVNDYVIGGKTDLKEKISKVLLRRRKVEVGGFTKRFAKTVQIDLSPIERQFYEETTDYVKREYNLAMGTKNRAVGFVMIVFQKLLDSSVIALLSALQKRKFMLESKFHYMKEQEVSVDDWDLDETEGVEDFLSVLDESEMSNFQRVKRELFTLNRLIHLGKQIKEDRKSQKLKETLAKLKKEGHKKFIIFTQFRTTQDHIHALLEPDFKIVSFHGSLSMDDKERAIQKFKEEYEIIICTEAGGEGRNLQFANILFNYDLPWSPLKIEQRIGRIHRFGQKDNVYIFNFASKDTVAERILEVLSNKIKLFEESIGASDELLGTIEGELDFNSSFMKFITGTKSKEELETEFDLRIQVAQKGFQKLNSLVTPKLLDFNLKDYYDHTQDERDWNNQHLEEVVTLGSNFFYNQLPGSLAQTGKGKYNYTHPDGKVKTATFDSEYALTNDSVEFLAFGHPFVEKVTELLTASQVGTRKKYVHSDTIKNKILFVFLVEFQFSLKRMEISFLEYDLNKKEIKVLSEKTPEWEKATTYVADKELSMSVLEQAFIQSFPYIENNVEIRKETLRKETLSIFQKEEYKIELSHQKTIRQLEEKLMRQEAAYKWDARPEKKAVLHRTMKEIQRVKEEFEIEIRKVRNGSKITHKIELFQTYIAY